MPWKAISPGSQYVLYRDIRAGLFGKKEEELVLQLRTSRRGKEIEIWCYADGQICFYKVLARKDVGHTVSKLASCIEGSTPPKKFPPTIYWQPLLVALSAILAEDYYRDTTKLEAQCTVLESELAIAREAEGLLGRVKKVVQEHVVESIVPQSELDDRLLTIMGNARPEVSEMVCWLYDADYLVDYKVESVGGEHRCTLIFEDETASVFKAKGLRELYMVAVVATHTQNPE